MFILQSKGSGELQRDLGRIHPVSVSHAKIHISPPIPADLVHFAVEVGTGHAYKKEVHFQGGIGCLCRAAL